MKENPSIRNILESPFCSLNSSKIISDEKMLMQIMKPKIAIGKSIKLYIVRNIVSGKFMNSARGKRSVETRNQM